MNTCSPSTRAQSVDTSHALDLPRFYAQADATAASAVHAAGGMGLLFVLALGDEPAFDGKERPI